MSKRDLLENAFANKKTARAPVGFWFHFVEDEARDGFKHPDMFTASIEGEKRFFDEFRPDFIKIMSDGFFHYPDEHFTNARSIADLNGVAPLEEGHPWIEKQVAYVKGLTDYFGAELYSFYNVFAPATLFRFGHGNHDKGLNADALLADLIREDRGAVERAFAVVAESNMTLTRRVAAEGGACGIYYSTQDPADRRIDEGARAAVFAACDAAILECAASCGAFNILHICGYAGYKNDLSHFAGFPATAVNWASTVERVSLAEGKRLFGGRCVIGGFGNTASDLLCTGGKAEVQAETKRLVAEAGATGVIIGADCTVPRTIDWKRLEWVRDAQ
ncbi:MAG: uroporphyrinogen decarboxylase [Spirochaetaceae bacterium]|jgi:uroporphyrinogen decarboxylase|nr:uroporphyrinogen decarboxylase [Spirochaetaceae bacterium]